jgi:hypothetical protein
MFKLYFCLPILILVLVFLSRTIISKITSRGGQEHPDLLTFTFVIRALLLIALLLLIRSCTRTDFTSYPDQAFNSEIWKKNEEFGYVRHTMFQSLQQNHSFLLGKNRKQVIDALGKPDTSSPYLDTDSTLYWRSKHPDIIMGGDEHLIIYFKKDKSYKIGIIQG